MYIYLHEHSFTHTTQLEQEIDIILEKTGVIEDGLRDWTSKWAPIILEYSTTLSGKKATMASQVRKECEGILW